MHTPYRFRFSRRALVALALIGASPWAAAQSLPPGTAASLPAAAPAGAASTPASSVTVDAAHPLAASGVSHPVRMGLLGALEQAKGRPLSVVERQAVHDALRDTVEAWRKTQAEFSTEAATLLHTTPEIIDSTLPRKGWHRVGATRDEGWIPRLEKALNRKITPSERHKLERLDDAKHANVWAAREQASARIAKALGLAATAVDSAWPWPAPRPSTPPASAAAATPLPKAAP